MLGAQVPDLLAGLLKKFAAMAFIAFLLSVPLSWYSLTVWLNSFAYKVNITGGVFIVAGIIMITLCGLSVAIPSFRAAASNPVNALKEN